MSPASQNLNDLEGAANAHTNVREVFAHSCDIEGAANANAKVLEVFARSCAGRDEEKHRQGDLHGQDEGGDGCHIAWWCARWCA